MSKVLISVQFNNQETAEDFATGMEELLQNDKGQIGEIASFHVFGPEETAGKECMSAYTVADLVQAVIDDAGFDPAAFDLNQNTGQANRIVQGMRDVIAKELLGIAPSPVRLLVSELIKRESNIQNDSLAQELQAVLEDITPAKSYAELAEEISLCYDNYFR